MKSRTIVALLASCVMVHSASEILASPAPSEDTVCCSSSAQCSQNKVCCYVPGPDCDSLDFGYCQTSCLPGGGN